MKKTRPRKAKPPPKNAVVRMTFIGGPLDGQLVDVPAECKRGGPFYTTILEWAEKRPSYRIRKTGNYLDYEEPKPKRKTPDVSHEDENRDR